ncbi:MAG: hypothetical protein E6176_04920 [Clostridium celatum]|nr:hypothetical protein [Clostridium celatum]
MAMRAQATDRRSFIIDASRPNVILVNAVPHAHGCTGAATAFFDRAFYSLRRSAGDDGFRMKVGARSGFANK